MNFEEMLKEMETLRKIMEEEMLRDFDGLQKQFDDGNLEGKWNFEPIDEPGMKGFIARGFFSTPNTPKIPTLPNMPKIQEPEMPKLSDTDAREPLYDLSEGDDSVQLLMELPGVEREEVKMNPRGGDLEVSAKNFHAIIKLPKGAIYSESVPTELRNGILTVTIPKIKGVEL